MRIYVDADDETPGKQPYAPSLEALNKLILPEHYLNQTQIYGGHPDKSHPSWQKFSTKCFGTGLFEISHFQKGVETILTLRDDCWRLNKTITNDPALDWEAQFGFTSTWDTADHPTKLRIKVIPYQQIGLLEFEARTVDIFDITQFPLQREAYSDDQTKDVQDDTQFNFGFFGYNMRPVREHIGNPNPCPHDDSMSIGLAIRKAISYACDRNEINQVVHRGEYAITDWPIYPKMGIWCNPNIIRYNFNLEKARKLMTIAGFGEYVPTQGFTMIIIITSLLAVASITFLNTRREK